MRVYRYRWTGTETFHRDGKQQLGMGDCQVRDGECQTRHMHFVILAYSLLMSELWQGHASEWAFKMLTTIGEACRAVMAGDAANHVDVGDRPCEGIRLECGASDDSSQPGTQ